MGHNVSSIRKTNFDVVQENGYPKSANACIYSDVVKGANGTGHNNCPKIVLDEDFDCSEYYPTGLVEVQGSLKMKNCSNLEKTFAKLRRIISGPGETPLIIYESSEAPSLEFLKRIEFRSAIKDGLKRYFEIYPKMSIDHYLPIAYTYGTMGWLADPIAEKSECFLDAHGNIKPSGDSCGKFKGDLVAGVDRLRPKIQEITGCLIVKNVTDLNFLKLLKTLGGKCQYAEYPNSPSYGFARTTFGKMREEYCPPRALREYLVPVLNLSSIQLSGRAAACAKACTSIIEGNCDSLFGDLTLTPDVYTANLEIIHGRLSIINTLFEEVIFPKLKEISSKTAPAVIIENNNELRLVDMELRPEITAADNGRPLVKITGNPKLQPETLSAFLRFYTNCEADPRGLCYLDKAANTRYWKWPAVVLLLPMIICLIIVLVIVIFLFLFKKIKYGVKRKYGGTGETTEEEDRARYELITNRVVKMEKDLARYKDEMKRIRERQRQRREDAQNNGQDAEDDLLIYMDTLFIIRNTEGGVVKIFNRSTDREISIGLRNGRMYDCPPRRNTLVRCSRGALNSNAVSFLAEYADGQLEETYIFTLPVCSFEEALRWRIYRREDFRLVLELKPEFNCVLKKFGTTIFNDDQQLDNLNLRVGHEYAYTIPSTDLKGKRIAQVTSADKQQTWLIIGKEEID